MPKPARTPYDVKLSPEDREAFGIWLCEEISNGLSARAQVEREVEYCHLLYEQGRTRSASNSPWPDAADLTSPIGTEKVDALRSRIVRTIFTDQPWVVEGWGEAAGKAPFVEEFHNWQAELEGFQGVFSNAIFLSLIEPCGVLEVYEDTIRRPVRKQIRAALQLAPDGTPLVDDALQPMLQRDPTTGKHVEVPETDPMTGMPIPSADVVIDDYDYLCNGPREREIAYRDFLTLPLNAQQRTEIWAYAKRFYRRIDDLQDRVAQGIYDKTVIEDLGDDDERASETTLAGEPQPVAQKERGLAEKELWEVTFLKSLDKTGLRWYVATVHLPTQTVLRLQYDDIGRPRYFKIRPFPKPCSTDGYSFIGHKLITVIEENTAWRNMLTDRASLQVQAPMGKLQGALWDPDDQPIGPQEVITMRQREEVFALELPDYTAPARERIIDTERQAEKLAGMSDIASGTTPNEDRTLGETQLININSEVRIEEVVHNVQETMEEIAQVRNVMWIRALKHQPDGIDLPDTILQGLEMRGANVAQYVPNKKFTAAMLEGAFKFKPKGSVETADKPRLQRLFAEGMKALAAIAQVNPMIAMILQQPKVAKELVQRWIYLYGGGMDKQAFLGAEAMQLLMTQIAVPGAIPAPAGPVVPGPPQDPPQNGPIGAAA